MKIDDLLYSHFIVLFPLVFNVNKCVRELSRATATRRIGNSFLIFLFLVSFVYFLHLLFLPLVLALVFLLLIIILV